jgi:hypothetical protein
MQNLRQRFGALAIAGLGAIMMIVSSAPMYAAGMSGPGADACAFVEGVAMKVPDGVPGMVVMLKVMTVLFGC